MKAVVPHRTTREKAMASVDGASDKLLGGGIKNLEIVDQKKTWVGPVMTFSLTGKLGFISLPLAGTVTVDDTNVTIECELPPLVKNFLGEERVSSMMEQNVRGLLDPGS